MAADQLKPAITTPSPAVGALLERVREVCRRPDLSDAQAVEGHGQNNIVLIVDEEIVARFPRYPGGIAALRREVALLRAIRGRLPLATPDPIAVSLKDVVGQSVMAYPLIQGEPLRSDALASLTDSAALTGLGTQVGGFLRALHAIPVADVLPDDLAAFDPVAGWRGLLARIERALFPLMRPDAREAVLAHFQAFFDHAPGFAIRPSLIHGDFGIGNILWDPAAPRITGVVDWSSAGVGDPAIDLAASPGAPPDVARGFRGVYPWDAAVDERVRFYQGTFALQEALFGIENGDVPAFEAGIAAYR